MSDAQQQPSQPPPPPSSSSPSTTQPPPTTNSKEAPNKAAQKSPTASLPDFFALRFFLTSDPEIEVEGEDGTPTLVKVSKVITDNEGTIVESGEDANVIVISPLKVKEKRKKKFRQPNTSTALLLLLIIIDSFLCVVEGFSLRDYEGKIVVGSQYIADTIAAHKSGKGKIYPYPYPILSRCFEGAVVACDDDVGQRIGRKLRQYVELMGGIFVMDSIPHETKYFVYESSLSLKYQVAAQRSLVIVYPTWIFGLV